MNEIKTLSLKTSGLLKDNGTMDDEGLNDLLHHLSIKIENIISISNGTMRNGNIEENATIIYYRS